MAYLLAIDWDQQQLHLVGVRTQRKGMQAQWAADWNMGEELTTRSAEAIGKRLHDFLKAEQVAASAVVVAIGREKVILKDIRYPAVAAGEETALVRFQATKDVTETPDLLEVDHVQRPGVSGPEKQALAVLTRKDVLNAVRGLCRGAGLKLLGVAPRPFGAPYALERTLQASGGSFAGTTVQGVLTVGQRWAELCLFRGHELLLARSLPAGPVLVGEVKRTLAVYAAQNAADPNLAGPATLYVFGNGQAPTAALAEALPCPVEVVSPLTIADAVAPREEHQASLAGAVGLAQRWAVAGSLPVNLAVQKKAQIRVSPTRQRWLVYGVLAGLVLCAGLGLMYKILADKRATILALTKDKNNLDDELKAYAQDRADIDALKEWDNASIPWLDELYDLTARFPYEKGFRINQFTVENVTPKRGKDGAKQKDAAKNPIIARVRIVGIAASKSQEVLVPQLRDALSRDAHLKATIEKFPGGPMHEFTIRIDVTKQPLHKYDTFLQLPQDLVKLAPAAKKKPAAEGDNE